MYITTHTDCRHNFIIMFDFDTLFDLMWDTDGNDMRRCGLMEESIFYVES